MCLLCASLQAGLFSATVTAFTVKSYRWLDETPAGMLARLQLRDLLNMLLTILQLINLHQQHSTPAHLRC